MKQQHFPALRTQEGNFFVKFVEDGICAYLDPHTKKILRFGFSEEWSKNYAKWGSRNFLELPITKELFQQAKEVLVVSEEYINSTSENCADLGITYTIRQPNGITEKILWVTKRKYGNIVRPMSPQEYFFKKQ